MQERVQERVDEWVQERCVLGGGAFCNERGTTVSPTGFADASAVGTNRRGLRRGLRRGTLATIEERFGWRRWRHRNAARFTYFGVER